MTGDGCPHESLTMNDPLPPSQKHTQTHGNPCCQYYPFPHTHTQKQVHLQILPAVVVCGVESPVDFTLFIFDIVFYIYKVLFIYFLMEFNGHYINLSLPNVTTAQGLTPYCQQVSKPASSEPVARVHTCRGV